MDVQREMMLQIQMLQCYIQYKFTLFNLRSYIELMSCSRGGRILKCGRLMNFHVLKRGIKLRVVISVLRIM